MNPSSEEQRRTSRSSKKRGSKIPTCKSNGSNPESRKRSRIPLRSNSPSGPELLSPESPPPPVVVPLQTPTSVSANVTPSPASSKGDRGTVRKSKLRSPASFPRSNTLLASTPKSRVPEIQKNGNSTGVHSKIPKLRTSPATEQSRLPKYSANCRSATLSDTNSGDYLAVGVSEVSEEMILSTDASSLSSSGSHCHFSESLDNAIREECSSAFDDNEKETEDFLDSEQELAYLSPDQHFVKHEVVSEVSESCLVARSVEEPAQNSLHYREDEHVCDFQPERHHSPQEGDSESTIGESGFHEDSALTSESSPMAESNPECHFFEDDEGMGDGSDSDEDPNDHQQLNDGSHVEQPIIPPLHLPASVADDLIVHQQTNDRSQLARPHGRTGQQSYTSVDGEEMSNDKSLASGSDRDSSSDDMDFQLVDSSHMKLSSSSHGEHPEYEVTEFISTSRMDGDKLNAVETKFDVSSSSYDSCGDINKNVLIEVGGSNHAASFVSCDQGVIAGLKTTMVSALTNEVFNLNPLQENLSIPGNAASAMKIQGSLDSKNLSLDPESHGQNLNTSKEVVKDQEHPFLRTDHPEEPKWKLTSSGIVHDLAKTEFVEKYENLNGSPVQERFVVPEAAPESQYLILEDFGPVSSDSVTLEAAPESQIFLNSDSDALEAKYLVDDDDNNLEPPMQSSSEAGDSSDGSESSPSETSSAGSLKDQEPSVTETMTTKHRCASPAIASEPAIAHAVQCQTVSWQSTTRTVSPAPAMALSNTEKILATSNMLKACIGQASVGTKVRSLRATMPMLTKFNNQSSSAMGGQEDDQTETSIEEVQDLSTLQQMLDAATNYDQRRRIRAQMRNVKKSSTDEKSSTLFLFDTKNGGQVVSRQQQQATPRAPSGFNKVSYSEYTSADGTGVAKSAQKVWQAIDSMVASSLNVDSEFSPAKNGNSHQDNRNHNFSLEDPDQSRKMGDALWVSGVNLADCNDELKLHEMLDSAEDYEDRKIIRARLKDVLAFNRAQREEIIRHREEEREEAIRSRLRDANEQKRRTLAMYDAMAKSAPAGGNKVLDVGILRGEDPEHKENYPDLACYHQTDASRVTTNTAPVLAPEPAACTLPTTGLSVSYSQLLSIRSAGSATNGQCYRQSTTTSTNYMSFYGSGSSTPTSQTEKVDFVEESIRQRQRESDDRKKTILAAYDQAAKSGPAGSARFVDFDGVKPEDIYNYENTPKYTSTFQMKGGVPIAKPAPPVISRPALHPQPYDPEEAAIRRRQQEANERKRRTLQAYDKAAKSRPAGTPFSVYIPSALDIEPVVEIAKQVKPLPVSPRERFQKMDSSNAPKGTNSVAAVPVAKTNLTRSPTAIKEMLLNWCRSKTKEYENIKIENFSSAWNDGMAFCALIHHFYPDAFDFNTLNPKNRRANFELAFRVAEEKGDVAPLLDVEDMVIMKKPDWKCVFTYVQSIYRRFHKVD